jgi:type IV secretory pathway protease TraF
MVSEDVDAVMTGGVCTSTVTVVEFTQPFASVPVTVYVVSDTGAAVTCDEVVVFNPFDGDQV